MTATEADAERSDDALQWTVWPAWDRRPLSLLAAMLIFGVSALVVLSYESPWYGLMVLVALFAATAPYYLPTHYRIDTDGVRLRTPLTTTSRPWGAFAAFFADEAGLLLSPSSRLNWMAYRRGIYLRCAGNLTEVRQYVERFVPAGASRAG